MPRHGSLADQLAALKSYRARPEIDEPIVPVATNWSTVHDANQACDEVVTDMRFERKRITTPSVAEIMRQCAPDEETGEVDIERNKRGQIVRIGRMKFSDGDQYEKGYKLGIDGDVIEAKILMPTGAMLGMRDKSDVQSGGTPPPIGSNSYFRDVFKTEAHAYRTRTKRRNGPSINHDDRKAILAKAYENTPVLPEVKKYPLGLPMGSSRVADSFLGMRKTTCAGGGGTGWEDMSTALIEREKWKAALASLSLKTRDVLDETAKAKNLIQIGALAGYKGKNAERRGKRELIAANDNLSYALKKAS